MKIVPGPAAVPLIRANVIPCIKAMREVTRMGLKETKELVEKMRDYPNEVYEINVVEPHYLPDLQKFIPHLPLNNVDEERNKYYTQTFIAVKQIIQEALDQNDHELMSAMTNAFRVVSSRKN